MNAEFDLHQAYAEWQRLALAEGQAIRAGNWPFVADCQQALGKLTSRIDSLTQKVRMESSAPPTGSIRRKFSPHATVLDLIELQRRNLASLEQRRQKLSDHIERLTRTCRNLRGIQRSYASPTPAAWSSYS
jgi:hypothetical protein